MTPTALVYMTHPVAPYNLYTLDYPQVKETHTTLQNLASAKRWLRALQDANPNVVVIAPWVTACEIYDDANPEERAEGLLRACYVVGRCDAIVLVGGRLGNGMMVERDHAIVSGVSVYDLTHMGADPPNARALLKLPQSV